MYRLQFSLQAASPETFGYTLVHVRIIHVDFPLKHNYTACRMFLTYIQEMYA
jgi:hypothetical protein